MSSKSVIVIGGGLAGLSAAVALAESGYRITLLEKRPFLGGRATSYVLPTGEHVDNCQHVTLGCCTNLDDFYRRAGASGKIRFYDRLEFSSPDGHRGTMYRSPLPAPFHLTPSFAKFPLLSWSDKRGIARLLMSIARSGGRPRDLASPDGVHPNMLDWLRRHKQTETAIQRFWGAVLISALDETLDRTDAQYGVDVFWEAFLANRAGYRIGIPTVPLADLYDGCRAALIQQGGEVRFRAAVRAVEVTGNVINGVSFESGEVLRADHYIAAVPQEALLELLPADIATRQPVFANLRNLRNSPITGVHLWFDRPVMTETFLTLLDTTTQWIFNKTLLYGGVAPANSGQYLQLVISASYDLVQKSRQEIVDICLKEVQRALPAARNAQLQKSTVIKETAATFSPAPGCDQWRPPATSPIRDLFLAGDWTATGWPATMEGAVRSGYLAAEALTNADGHPQKFLKLDLPVEGISRLIAKRT
ncbi:MAG TPA: hydroxysqualene dehydroxylase HpnE [Candidatus Limnocylindrales bacterium]|nr:hydroxysqualene dehydroxylase HpnE [Candidatus Limnocylindrales bacterium]